MKKFLVVCTAAMLMCLHGAAQEYAPAPEADNSRQGVGLSIIPRLDLNYNYKGDFTLGDSSLYSLIEGNLSDNLSLNVCTHFLASDFETIGLLYKNTFRSDDVNWLDWAYLGYTTGNFEFSLGKQPLTYGGFEFDEYDFEAHSTLASSLWNNLPVYQWGAKVNWTNSAENTSFSLQMTTSPFGEHPFVSGLYNYALEWRGNYGSIQNIWSVAAVQTAPGKFMPLVSLGQKLSINEYLSYGLDAYNAVGDPNTVMAKGLTMIPSIIITPSERVQLRARLCGEMNFVNRNKDLIGGLDMFCFPIKDNDNFRVHAAAACRYDERLIAFTVGALYYLNFPRK